MRKLPKYTDNDIDEDMKLTRGDYIKILHHYQPDTRRSSSAALLSSVSTKSVKERAHRILAEKLCRCIKPSGLSLRSDMNEGRRIAYCTRSIFNNRGLRQHGFRCKTAKRNDTRRKVMRPRMTADITKTKRRLQIL
jgi:hypothetical protein